ncbi:MAG: dual specificity protein kinase FUZ7 [Piptocephalis tieghemiana]|nr:MAG: dual specificity protein kinase FUZ7 [Piptocephalis tieghemiana]
MASATSGIRKKRNFKGLALPNSPVVGGDKAPPAGIKVPGQPAPEDELAGRLKALEIGVELKLDLRSEDLEVVKELGAGAGGTVSKVLHLPTKTIMARKIIKVETNPQVKNQILRELQIMHDCNSSHIVSFYGAFMSEGDISVCMEYMDVGAFDSIYRKHGPIPVKYIGRITHAVLAGLVYLYDSHRIIHRDIKPSNILMNSTGLIKICDFGVSGVLVNSYAKTFVGTSHYMSPERIKGSPYSVRSDVWSLGITLQELALGRFPFPPEGTTLSVLELLQFIVNEPAPTLPAETYSEDFKDFVDQCLIKDIAKRPTPAELQNHPFILNSLEEKVDLEAWATALTQGKKE